MITSEYCATMARYNAWQNSQVRDSVKALSDADLTRDKGAFFGSILGTLNHLLWGDALWISRFDGGTPFRGGIAHSTELTSDAAEWWSERAPLDARIQHWADTVTAERLAENLTWVAISSGQKGSEPLATCATHFFNHQTHHRGQVHALLTAAGVSAPVSDLAFLPKMT